MITKYWDTHLLSAARTAVLLLDLMFAVYFLWPLIAASLAKIFPRLASTEGTHAYAVERLRKRFLVRDLLLLAFANIVPSAWTITILLNSNWQAGLNYDFQSYGFVWQIIILDMYLFAAGQTAGSQIDPDLTHTLTSLSAHNDGADRRTVLHEESYYLPKRKPSTKQKEWENHDGLRADVGYRMTYAVAVPAHSRSDRGRTGTLWETLQAGT
ncbi:hypothetical protein HK097_002757, partial [Rhizophlyctis rosea]